MQIRPEPPVRPSASHTGFEIGNYDSGPLDLSDPVTMKYQQSFTTHEDALRFARSQSGAEMLLERVKPGQGLGFDVYQLTIHDSNQKLSSLQEMKHLNLFERPVNQIQQQTGLRTQRAYVVAENGEISAPLYPQRFDRTRYDHLRSALGLQDSQHWFQLVDKYMTAPSPEDALPPLSAAEIKDLKAHLQPGDIIMSGNNGSFIHGIVYVGQDPELQAQLEKKWQLAPGALNGEGLILHSLAADHSAEIELNGQKIHQPAGGTGVIIDTLERYHARNPRDVMMAVEVTGATAADRRAVIAEGKKMIGRAYDNGFNTFDDRDIYCTEFVYKAWLAAPDTPPDFATQRHPLVPQKSAPLSSRLYPHVSQNWQKEMEDDGYLHQEMIMTDGILASPSIRLTWASQNADRSAFFQKHQRWAEGMAGRISADYQALLQQNVPQQAARSTDLLSQSRQASGRTRQSLVKPE